MFNGLWREAKGKEKKKYNKRELREQGLVVLELCVEKKNTIIISISNFFAHFFHDHSHHLPPYQRLLCSKTIENMHKNTDDNSGDFSDELEEFEMSQDESNQKKKGGQSFANKPYDEAYELSQDLSMAESFDGRDKKPKVC